MDKNIKLYAIEKMAADNVGKSAPPAKQADGEYGMSEWQCPECDTEVMVSRKPSAVKCPMCGCPMEEVSSDTEEDMAEGEED